jgi:hypothetical protein
MAFPHVVADATRSIDARTPVKSDKSAAQYHELLCERGSTQIPVAVRKLPMSCTQQRQNQAAFIGKRASASIHDKPGLRLDPVARRPTEPETVRA